MSKTAREEFKNARARQTTQNDARRIRQRVEAAQQGPARAGVRWPFELIQNAHDAGPRDGDERVEIDFVLCDDRLLYHTQGNPLWPRNYPLYYLVVPARNLTVKRQQGDLALGSSSRMRCQLESTWMEL